MSTPRHSDDPELRALLDSIGITEKDSIPDELTEAESERAERMLERILSQAHESGPASEPGERTLLRRWLERPWLLNLTVAASVCLLVGVVVVAQPWGGTPAAVAQTPPMLRFTDVKAGQIEPSGEPAAEVLRHLAARAAEQSTPADYPVQLIELDGWWASSAPSTDEADTRSVLVPTHSRAYLLPNGDRRSIERRGDPLDAEGRLATTPADWDTAPLVSDTITALDPERGVDYPSMLPTSAPQLREELAPEAACAQTPGGCLLGSITELFESYVIPPEVTARLWETLATEPTITTLGPTVDRRGRDAIALTAPSPNPRQQLLVLLDPDTGRYLGSETILIAPDENFGFDPPAVITFTALITAERITEEDVPDDSTAERF